MPGNKAQRELQSLLDMEKKGREHMAHARSLSESRPAFANTAPPEDADFDFKGALGTAMGVGFVLGPVGGLLVGVARGILDQRERKSAVDAYTREIGILEAVNGVYNDELEQMDLAAENDYDRQQVAGMRAMKDKAMLLSTSGYDAMQQQGTALMADYSQRKSEYNQRQEEQHINRDVLQKQLDREIGSEKTAQYNRIVTGHQADSQMFTNVMRESQLALEALANGSPTDLYIAGNAILGVTDPAGVKRKEEVDALGTIGSWRDRFATLLDEAKSGETMSAKTRKEMTESLYNVRSTWTRFQGAAQARVIDEFNDFGIDKKFHNNIDFIGTTPAASPGDIDVPTGPQEDVRTMIEGAMSDAARQFGGKELELYNSGKKKITDTFNGVKNYVQGAVEYFQSDEKEKRQ